MPYTVYTKQHLSDFSGRPVASYRAYSEKSALPQALLLFKLGTCLASPDGLTDDQKQLVDFAILAMADKLSLAQRYQKAAASPFSSETIGSYSYSKAARAIQRGEGTGVEWFDTALEMLSVCDQTDTVPMSGGIEVFEHDALFTSGAGDNLRMLSPKDLSQSQSWGFDPTSTHNISGV